VPYSEVNKNISDNLGLNVRWGGEIIGSKDVEEGVELTVLANKLGDDSRPLPRTAQDNNDDRFIVVVGEYERPLLRRHITVFGQISSERTLVNGPRTRKIPVVTAIETMEWNSVTPQRSGSLARYDGSTYINYYSGFRNSRFNRSGRFSKFKRFNKFNSFNRFGRSKFGHSKFGNKFGSHNRFRGRSFFGRKY